MLFILGEFGSLPGGTVSLLRILPSKPLTDSSVRSSKLPVLFLVELGAAIKMASTTVPVLSSQPLVAKVALMVANNWLLS